MVSPDVRSAAGGANQFAAPRGIEINANLSLKTLLL
jgi:hypothetical protein